MATEDLNKTSTTTPATGTTGTTATTTSATPSNASTNGMDAYNANREQKIRDMYAGSKETSLSALKTAYDQNMSTAQQNYDKISPQYQTSRNELSAEYERQRRNNNMQAAANGLNTGAGSQMQLAQSNAYQTGQAGLQKQENEALDTANRGMQDIKMNYQNSIAEATAKNDYQLAAALLDEYGQQYERQMDQANQMAQFGDFSGYVGIYGQAAADSMEKSWALQNPLLAYNLGKLTADEYFKMTGSYPRGYSAGGGGGGYGGGSSGGGWYDANGRFNPYAGGYTTKKQQAIDDAANGIDIYSPLAAYDQNKSAEVQGFSGNPQSEQRAQALLTQYNNKMAAHYGS